jgi:hypothetical protein
VRFLFLASFFLTLVLHFPGLKLQFVLHFLFKFTCIHIKKIQKETKRQNKKICDQANYLKGRVETMTNERKETNESVHKLERQRQQTNPNFRLPSEQIPLVFWINNVSRL